MGKNLNRVVGATQPFVEVMPKPIIAQRAPAVTDTDFPKGQIWLDESASPNALYTHIGGGIWDSGGNASASTTVPGIVLINTDGTLAGADNSDVPTSLAVKTYADALAIAGSPAATTVQVGITRFSTDAEAVAATLDTVAVMPANLPEIFAAPQAIGGTTPKAGVFTTLESTGLLTIGASATITTGATALNLGNDAGTGAVNVGTGAAARVITIGNVSGATQVAINAGTAGIALASTGAGDITINSNDTLLLDADGVLEINSSAGVIGIGSDADAFDMNYGTGAAARVLTFGNSSGATQIDLNSGSGGINVATNAIAQVVTIGNSTGATSIVVNCGTGALNVGTNAIAHAITIGNVTGATAVVVNSGTGACQWNTTNGSFLLSTGTGAINLGTDAAAKTLTIGNGTGATSVVVNCGTGALNIGTNTIAHTVTIGNVTGATAVNINTGTGNFALEGATASTYDISSTGVNTGTVRIASGTGARTVEIAGGGTGAKTINIGAAASADLITIGDATGAGSLDLACGTGNFTLEGATASTYDISATGINTGTVRIASGTGARTVEIAGGGTGAKTINIGAAASADVITVGTSDGAGSLALACGTGNFTLEGATASTYEISSTGVNTGTCKFASGTGARTVEIAGGGTGAKTINIGAAASADVITIGTTDGAGSLTLAAGTGDITVSGTVKEINAEFLAATGDDITFQESPICLLSGNAPALPTGATGTVNLLGFRNFQMEQFCLGAGQTIIAPVMDATGLLVSGDLTNTEGFEFNFGAALATSRHAFTIGTSAAFFFECKFTVADVSGANPYMIGFRKSEANNATLASYTDYAMIGLDAAVNDATVILKTELNSGGTTNTNTTDAWTDGQSHTVKVLVSVAGVVTYTIDGSAPSSTAAFTFDNADIICPFIRLEHGAAAPGAVHLETLKIGFQA